MIVSPVVLDFSNYLFAGGIVNCEQNVEKCGMPEFSSMMIKFCPATCGLCLTKRCRDQIEECGQMKELCTNELYSVFMEHQCAKTCGKCKSDEDEETDGGGGEVDPDESEEDEEVIQRKTQGSTTNNTNNNGKECVDLMKNCARNKKFCHHPSYLEMMRKNCAKVPVKHGEVSLKSVYFRLVAFVGQQTPLSQPTRRIHV
jgi:hypothetical protein